MTITKTQTENTVTLAVSGRLDTATAIDFEKEIDAVLALKLPEFILDFKELEYTSSAGLRAILKAQKGMLGVGSLKLINVNDSVMEVFEITGFSDILTIE